MLSVKDLFCERDERVLFERLSFAVAPGQALQIQGSNGSGKTTLLRILCGLNQDFSGEILWQNEPVQRKRARFHQNIFYLGHTPAINKSLTPAENLRWFCASHGIGGEVPLTEALESFRLYGYEDFPCYQMSAGQQRRVSLARMKLSRAQLWILDEPFTALDKQGVEELEHLLGQHVEAGGSLILTTHHPLRFAQELTVINLDELAESITQGSERAFS